MMRMLPKVVSYGIDGKMRLIPQFQLYVRYHLNDENIARGGVVYDMPNTEISFPFIL